jgi:glycosyltransferase involved in cell wall biosynthesis
VEEKRLKIAYLSVFFPFRGGIAQFNTELFKALASKADVKAFNFSTQYPDLLFPGKTQFVSETDVNPGIKSERLLSSVNPFTFSRTIKAIKAYKPDVLITAFWMPYFGPSLGYVTKQLKGSTKNISILHNVIPHEGRKGDKALTNFYLNQQDGFGVLSETVKQDLLGLKGDAKLFQRAHPLYAQFGELKDKNKSKLKYGIDPNKKVLLFFGFVRKYKGLDLLVEAIKYLPKDTVVLITGECYGDFKAYSDLIKSEGVSEDQIVSHIRYIPDDEVAQIFSASDLCILPYKSATQSGIASIAKFYQLPMIVTPVGELPNEVVDGETGIVCKSSSPIDVANGIKNGLEKEDQLKANLKSEKEEHTWSNFADALINFSNSI